MCFFGAFVAKCERKRRLRPNAEALKPPCGPIVELIHDSQTWLEQRVVVSGILITYNQAAFVREALNSLLQQTYPMEIIVSDDASSDETVTVVREVLGVYNGSHRITLRSNIKNLGICDNQNSAIAMAGGELIVLFEGDDVSAPTRVELLTSKYLAARREVAALGSGIQKMDVHGCAFEEVSWLDLQGDVQLTTENGWTVQGCSLAFRRDCFFDIGPISRHLISGDIALWMRACFVRNGGLALVPAPLVKYRIHSENTSAGVRLDYTSPAALRECCRRLLKNEIAQLFELRKIARYRRHVQISGDSTDALWAVLYRTALQRAKLVFAVSKYSRARWICPAAAAMRHAPMRRLALRVLALALIPALGTAYYTVKPIWKGVRRKQVD